MTLEVLVKTNSKSDSIEIRNNIYHITTKNPARDNMANIAIVELLSNYLKIQKRRIHVKRGLKYKKKIIEILDE